MHWTASTSRFPAVVLGLLGQNGAGKTTLLRILSTSLKPKLRRRALRRGGSHKKPARNPAAHPGLSPATPGFTGGSPRAKCSCTAAACTDMQAAALRERIDELSGTLDMEAFLDRRNETFSSGMRPEGVDRPNSFTIRIFCCATS